MAEETFLDSFCGSRFWEKDFRNSSVLDFSPCLQKTVFVWVPCGFLWLFTPLELYYFYYTSKKLLPWSLLNIAKMIIPGLMILVSAVELVHNSNSLINSTNFQVDVLSHFLKIATLCLAVVIGLLCRQRGCHSSGTLFLFWLLMVFANLAIYYSSLLNVFNEGISSLDEFLFVTTMIYFPLVLMEFILHCFADEDICFNKNECPEPNASFLSKLLFWWFTDLAIQGWKKPLTQPDLWLLRHDDRTKNIISIYDKYWQMKLKKLHKSYLYVENGYIKDKKTSDEGHLEVGVTGVLCKTFGPYFFSGAILKLFYDILQFVNPQILGLLISFTAGNEPLWKGIFYAVTMFATATVQSVLIGAYFHCMFVTGMRVRTVLISAIYRKSLILSNNARRVSTLGEIVNLMSVDAQRFMDLMTYLNLVWSSPLQIILAIYFLWNILGPSVLAGIGVMILMIPLNILIANKIKKLQVKQMDNKDIRVKEMNEILNGIKVLKLYAWEEPFQEQILKIRNKEISQLKLIAYLGSAASFLWTCAPVLVALATFTVYIMADPTNILDANTAFVSISLFNILRFPLAMLPNMISMLVMVNVSVKRINKFLNTEELNPYVTSSELTADSILIENGTFTWSHNEKPTLKNISLSVPVGSLVAVVGQVGCGKSSLISAILGEMELVGGKVNVKGKVAYVPQVAWIQNATIQQNILFTESMDRIKYDDVVKSCALLPDFSILPGGDMTEIGEKGINLSGGQKQRISLARAVYSNSDIYLLDDPLSAVDSHVGKHLFEHVIGPSGLLKKKTRILVSHGITFLPQVDMIVVLKDGTITEMGSYNELLQTGGVFSEFILQYLKEEGLEKEKVEMIKEMTYTTDITLKKKLMRTLSEVNEQFEQEQAKSVSSISRSSSETSQDHSSFLSMKITSTNEKFTKLVEIEAAETGQVKYSVYKNYFKAVGYSWLLAILVSYIAVQAFSVGSNIWLSIWSNDKPNPDGSQDIAKRDLRLGVYGGLGGGQGVAALLGSFALSFGTVKASFLLHRCMLLNVMRSPMSFFETTPLGRIINRFSKDIDTVDVTIPMTIRSWLQCFLNVLGTLFVISLNTPVFLIIILPLSVIYYLVQKFYIATSRQLKRLESITRSPIYSHFSETLTGVTSVRAYHAQNHFIYQCNQHVDINNACYYPSIVSNRWLAINLEFCGNCIILFAALFAVLERENLDAGTVGLIISYALPVTAALSWMVRMNSELETNIVAVERIIEYSETPTEAEWEIPEQRPDFQWPQEGNVEIVNYSTRYRCELDLVLRDITCSFAASEKIGVVGRTGAGKSSLTLSLFRIIEAAAGSVVIDNIDISEIGLHDLRARLTIIPQDPILFSGTLRFNLDPFSRHVDHELWQALEQSHLKSFVSKLDKGLMHPVSEGGENLSVGQRQLICLARALLRKTKILVLDEATAAVDLETDDLIQATIRQVFADCTIITIAHRLNTVIDYDRILVLNKGVIAEFDKPSVLLKDKASLFYSMAKDAGIV